MTICARTTFSHFAGSSKSAWGVVTRWNEINHFRIIFKFAYDQRLIDRPVHYGQGFDKPAAKELRRARNQAGPRMFAADELRRILKAADPIMQAMTLPSTQSNKRRWQSPWRTRRAFNSATRRIFSP